MAHDLHSRRLLLLAFLLLAAFGGLAYRLVDLQVLRHDSLEKRARGNWARSIEREPRRGEIRDIRGTPLVTSVFVKTICADPTLIGHCEDDVARTLSPLLEMDESLLREKLRMRVIRHNDRSEPVFDKYVVLKRDVRLETWERIREAMKSVAAEVDVESLPNRKDRQFYYNLRRRAVFADAHEHQMRVFPHGRLAGHVIGFTGLAERERNGEKMLETEGKYGIEQTFDAQLSGIRGWRETESDSRGNELVAFRDQNVDPRDGLHVVLTLDANIQYIVESELFEAMREHNAVGATAVVTRPKTGEILALVSLPNFDPADPGATPPATWRNRVISDIYEPGSTFKVVVISAALNEGLVGLDDPFNCENGTFYYAGRRLRDHGSYGILTIEEIITKSSNIGAAKVGLLLGKERMYQYMRDYGFGSQTRLPLAGEVRGQVHPTRYWSKLSITRIPMGHEVAVTPLQMAMAMSAIANGGKLMRPMLVDRLVNDEGRVVMQYQPTPVRQVVSPSAARKMVTALKTVPRKGGTGTKAALEHYHVAGKTGTAQKAGNGGYIRGAYFASFSGFFPADDPELCITVIFDEPRKGSYYGGSTGGPVFKRVARRAANYLNIPPDKQNDDTLVMTGFDTAQKDRR